jgi:hypothetical protein
LNVFSGKERGGLGRLVRWMGECVARRMLGGAACGRLPAK